MAAPLLVISDPPEVPLLLLVVLLVVPDDVPPVLRLGTLLPKVGTDPPRLGTAPGSAGTDGTDGPALVLVPAVVVTGAVMTVVAPDESAGGITRAAAGVAAYPGRPLAAGVGAEIVVDVVGEVEAGCADCDELAAPTT